MTSMLPSFLDRLLRRERSAGLPGPVVIGGVGGSGTRLLAEVLIESGFYLGCSLNRALDNLWYTLLLRRAGLFPGARPGGDRDILKALELFEAAMTQGLNGSPKRWQRHLVREAVLESIEEESRDQPREAQKSLMASAAPDAEAYRSWGWKEPNTHIHLEALARAFPEMRYVLLIRHGLDMAFSPNRAQLRRWGRRFDVTMPEDETEIPAAALRYWVRANRRALEVGGRLLGERFLVIRYDDLCHQPAAQMSRFLEFAGAEVEPDLRECLLSLPHPPDSMGRYREVHCSRFAPEDLRAVQELGFEILV